MDRDDRLRGFPNRRWADVLFEHIEFINGIDESVHVAAHRCDDGANQLLPEFRRDVHNHAIVHQNDSRIGLNQNIAGMGICMEKTVNQKLSAIKLDQVFDHSTSVDVVAQNFIDFVHAKSLEELHDQNPGGGDFSIDPRDNYEVAVTVQIREALGVLGFVKEVHLFSDHPREFLHDGAGGTNDVMIDELLEDEDKVLNDTDVRGDKFFDAGPEDLHDHFIAAISGAMYLPERGSRQGLRFKGLERLIDRPLELGLNTPAKLAGREGRHSIMEVGQLFNVNMRDDIRA